MRSDSLQQNRLRGFTLVELLVAITVLAIVAIMGWQGLSNIVRAREQLNSDLERTREMQLSFAQIETDCSNVVSSEEIQGRDNLVVNGSDLYLIRWVREDLQADKIQIVAYRFADGKLSRSESQPTRDLYELRAEWQRFLSNQDQKPGIVLENEISEVSYRTWRNGENTWQYGGAIAQTDAAPNLAAGPNLTGTPNAQPILPISGSSPASAAVAPTANAQQGNENQLRARALKGLEINLKNTRQTLPMTKVFLLGSA